MQIALVLGVLVAALILFPFELVGVDIVALGALLVLVVARIVPAEVAFASFGNEMMILLASIFVIAGALLRTGVLDSVGLVLYRRLGGSYRALLAGIVLTVSLISAFMNNTVVTAVFVPVVLAVARRAKIPPSKLLMPVAFAAMLGGCTTLVGTSTNIAASNFIVSKGMEPFRLFEFLPIGLALTAGGILYFVLLGGRLLPSRGGGDLIKDFHVQEYLTQASLRAGCPFTGKRLDEVGLEELAGAMVLGIVRGNRTLLAPGGHVVLESGDTLLVEAGVEGIQRLRQTPGVEVKGDAPVDDRGLESDSIKLAEVMIGPGSRFVGRSLKEVEFRRRYGMTALALSRRQRDVLEKIGKIPLRVGDVLLVQGPEARLNDLRRGAEVFVLSDLSHFLLERRKGIYVVLFFIAGLGLGAAGVVPLGVSVLAAAVATVLVRAIPGEEVYRSIDWRLLVMIGAMTAFGQAMVRTGADVFLAGLMVRVSSWFGPYGILAGFFVLTVALSQPLSNAAAALAVLPIAVATAERIGANPRTFAVVVTMAASASFITPLEPSCVLVYPAGRYRFIDFVKVGAPLTLVTMVVVLGLVPFFWPL
ncbi:MAG: potassium transporter TrkA [Acidobacteria bacterium]|nr:MAG: potassium transporter TrkA [Acidobacteriota bacterium]